MMHLFVPKFVTRVTEVLIDISSSSVDLLGLERREKVTGSFVTKYQTIFLFDSSFKEKLMTCDTRSMQ